VFVSTHHLAYLVKLYELCRGWAKYASAERLTDFWPSARPVSRRLWKQFLTQHPTQPSDFIEIGYYKASDDTFDGQWHVRGNNIWSVWHMAHVWHLWNVSHCYTMWHFVTKSLNNAKNTENMPIGKLNRCDTMRHSDTFVTPKDFILNGTL
jgi:hypothetical protein